MATNPKQIKINILAKDFNMKTKEVVDILAAAGIDKKTSGTIDTDEFSVFLSHVTTNNQITNMTDYLAGKAEIPKEAVKKTETSKSESAPKSSRTKSAAASKETAKTAAKEAATTVPSPSAPVAPVTPVTEAPKTEAPKAEAPKAEVPKTEAPKTEAPKTEETKTEIPKTESSVKKDTVSKVAPKESLPKENVAKDVPARETAEKETSVKENTKEMPRRENTTKNPASAKPSYETKQGTAGETRHTERSSNASQKAPAFNRTENNFDRRQNSYGQKTQENTQNRQQFNQRANNGGNNYQNGQNNNAGAAQRQQRQTNVNASAPAPAAPQVARPIPQPQPQKPKEKKEQQPIAPKTTRIVDTRTTSVDLSKYDERLENFVPESARRNNAPDRQKLKKQRSDNPYAKGNKDKNKNTPDKFKKQEIKKTQLSITIPDEITVSELAQKLKVTASEVIKRLMMMGVMATVNQTIDYDTAFFVADELGAKATREVVVTIEEKLFDEEPADTDAMETRPPVVCVMGHVDHGKTSLLDAIRNTHVTAGEAGGITQHIGAYRVNCNGQYITFLDTPGHEAFTAMRARGAKSTDIAILVVAADDGIMPQTVEAINHAKAANIPIIVAINKIDKPTANPDSIKTELTKYDLVPEEWGGDVICVPVSALRGDGISDLLENVLLVAEVEDFKADPKRRAKGIVIEAKLDRGRGPVATVLIQNGTLHTGDTVIVGTAVGHVRAMTNDKGQIIKEAGPSVPVEIIGLDSVPSAGDEINAVEDERMAKELAEQRRQKEKEEI